jgi:hypothetical protein
VGSGSGTGSDGSGSAGVGADGAGADGAGADCVGNADSLGRGAAPVSVGVEAASRLDPPA